MRLSVTVLAMAMLVPLPGAAAAAGTEEAPVEASKRETSFTVVPGPFYNPELGLGLMVFPMMQFYPSKTDAVSPPSVVALLGMYAIQPPLDEASTRYSYAFGAGTRVFLDEDRWRLAGVVGYFDVFEKFRGIGGDTTATPFFDYRDQGLMTIAQILRQVGWKPLYAGLRIAYNAVRTKTDDPANQAILEALGTGADWRGDLDIGVAVQIDTKDNQYYPSSGVDFKLSVHGSAQSDQEYIVLEPSVNEYFPLAGNRLVLAYRFFAQLGFGNLGVMNYAYYGSRGSTLGYPSGAYVDKMMAGLEAEVRWLFWWRLGLEGGFGIGKVFPSFDAFGPQPWLPGVWGSVTYQPMQESDIRARLTLAAGNPGAALYFSIGEVF